MSSLKFVYVTYIASTPEKLWRALTESQFTKQYWFGFEIEADWKSGGRICFVNEGKVSDSGEVLEWRPHTRLSYGWQLQCDEISQKENEISQKEKPSRVCFDLEPMGKETKLTVTHDQFEPGSKVFGSISNGWPLVLSSLKSFLETGCALAAPAFHHAHEVPEQAVARAS